MPSNDQPVSPVSALSELIDYGEDAIVSRILLKTKGGSATLFAFDAGQELSEHTTPFEAMVQVIDGQGVFRIAGEPHTVKSGQMLRLPADVPHAVEAKVRFKMILTMLR